jgi:hypothetical protein
MGLDYSYLLYFPREQLWDALQGLLEMAQPYQPPIQIHFQDHELSVPLKSWTMKDRVVKHDDPVFGFDTVLLFEEDDEIINYLGDRYDSDLQRGPPGKDGNPRVWIGYIYLAIYNDILKEFPQGSTSKDLVLFDFGTTGTKMSTLFAYSESIRKAFRNLLVDRKGVCGVFNRESSGGEAFWYQGQPCDVYFDDPYLSPHEIGQLIRLGGPST